MLGRESLARAFVTRRFTTLRVVYVDPIGDPIRFAKTVALRLPMLIGNALWLIEAGIGELWPAPIIAIGLLGAAAFVAAYAKTSWAVPPGDDDPTLALLAWRDGKIDRIAPSELLNGLTIAWTPGPIGGI